VPHPQQPAEKPRPPQRAPKRVPPTTIPLGERLVGSQPVIALGQGWAGGTLAADITITVPVALGGAALVFIVLQWLIDRRDPKYVEAPARKDEDSVGFD
jgi:hypothetical protein